MAETSISGIEFSIKGSTERAKTAVDNLVSSLKKLKTSLQGSSTGKLKEDMEDIDGSAKKTTTTLGKLMKSIGRITFYRAIRSAIRFVTDGFKEGLENAYQFSKIVGYDLAATMDNLASQSLKMKNQLGSAFGGLIMAVEPILLQLIALITRAANAISQLMAIIAGKATYLKAIDTVVEYGEAVSGAGQAAKEAMKYLAPFDELNRLPGDNGSGGGGGGAQTPDYSAMFEETPVSQSLADFVTNFKITFNDVIFDWEDLTGEQIAEKALSGLFALTGAGVGFLLGGLPGAVIGTVVGVAISLLIDTMIFDHDGVLSQQELGDTLSIALSALCGGIIGFFAGGGIPGAIIGATIGLGVSAVIKGLDFTSGGTVGGDHLLEQFATALSVFAGATIGFFVGNVPGALIGAAIGLGVAATITGVEFEATGGSFWQGLDYFATEILGLPTAEEWETWGENIWKDINKGINSGWQWLVDGFNDFKTELYNIFIKPIVDAFDEFIENHPKIASWLGFSHSGSSAGSGLSGSGSMTLDLEANITDIKDSVPAEKKTLGQMLADLTGTTDSIPASDKKTSGWQAVLNTFTPKFTSGAADSSGKFPLLSAFVNLSNYTVKFGSSSPTADASKKFPLLQAIANLSNYSVKFGSTSPTADSSKKFPLLQSVANMSNYQTKFASGTADASGKFPLFASVAKFTTKQDGLTDAQKQFNTRSNFMYRNDSLTDAQKQFNTKANFTTSQPGWKSNPLLNAIASFISAKDNIDGTPSVDAEGRIISAYDDIPEWDTPTVAVKGSIYTTDGQDIRDLYAGLAIGGVIKHGIFSNIPQYASGTSRAHGSLFVAGEAGPEVVGHIGGRTEVLNRSQLAATMYAAVTSAMSGLSFHVYDAPSAPSSYSGEMDEEMIYRAMLRALNDSDAFPDEINLDGATVYKKMVQRNRMERARTGMNPMLSY